MASMPIVGKLYSHPKCNGTSGCTTSLPGHKEVTKPLAILEKNKPSSKPSTRTILTLELIV